MEVTYDVAIVGGGPAGCAAAITAGRHGLRTALFERGQYPRHRVCGEFVSPESHHVLESLLGGTHPLLATAPRIIQARLFSDGNCVEFKLEEPAWSIARYDLDLALWQMAELARVECAHDPVERVTPFAGFFRVELRNGRHVRALRVINASGRWSNLRRPVVERGPRWIGIKAHFTGEEAPPSTDIYFFEGGYCGVQPISRTHLNASAMVRADVATTIEEVFAEQPDLRLRSQRWERTTEVFTTSPLVHVSPEPVTDGVLNAGDAAAFIDPFVGDGISLALRSGVLAAQSPSPEAYSEKYHLRFDKVFQTARLARRLVHAPEAVRRVAAFTLRSSCLRNWALKRTRAV